MHINKENASAQIRHHFRLIFPMRHFVLIVFFSISAFAGRPGAALQTAGHDSSTLQQNMLWINWGVGYISRQGAAYKRPEGVLSATFIQNGTFVVTGEDHRTVVWNCETGRVTKVLGLSKEGTMAMCCLPGDSLFATATGSVISIWRSRSLTLKETILERGVVREMGFSSDGRLMFTLIDSASHDGILRLWDCRKKLVIADFAQNFRFVLFASFSPDGRSILISGDQILEGGNQISSSVSEWNIASGKMTRKNFDDPRLPKWLSYSPDGKFIAEAFERVESNWEDGNDTTVKVWDASSGKCMLAVTDSTNVTHVAFFPSGNRIASVSEDGAISINTIGGAETAILQRDDEDVRGPIAISLNGKLLLCGAPYTKAVLWDVEHDSTLRNLDPKHSIGHRASVWAVAGTQDEPNGRLG